MGELTRYIPPAELAPELRAEVDFVLAPLVRLPGIDADDPGMVLTPSEPRYQPGAEAAAAERRAALAQPATPEMIRNWLELIAGSVANTPDDNAITLRVSVLALYDDLPAPVWTSRVAVRQAVAAFKFWPSGAEIVELQQRCLARLKGEIYALERIAKGERGPRNGLRPSTAYLDRILASGSAAVPTEAPAHLSSPRPGIADDFDDIGGRYSRPIFPYATPLRTVEEQLAAFGMTMEQARAGLKAHNEPEQPAEPEAPSAAPPVLKVVK